MGRVMVLITVHADRGTGEFCLRLPAFRQVLKRGYANQPGLTFPQSPGIIPEACFLILASDSARFSSFNEL